MNEIIKCKQHNESFMLPDGMTARTTSVYFINPYFYLKYKRKWGNTDIYQKIKDFCKKHEDCGIKGGLYAKDNSNNR